MIVVSNTSPLIALSRIGRLDILQSLFGKVLITPEVLSEVLPKEETEDYHHIMEAVNDFIIIQSTTSNYLFKRTIDKGERSVLNLAYELNADVLIIDDRKARNEGAEMNLNAFIAYTTDILKQAETENLISSYSDIQKQLKEKNIYLPDFD
jgi:predicted nucleic acid-binding protein